MNRQRAAELSGMRRFAPTTLDELVTEAELLTRVDRKYIVTREQAEQALAILDPTTRVLELSGQRSSSYESVYYDTPSFEGYLLAAHGRRRRVKIRTRSYLDTETSFLEVKTRGGRDTTVKERVAVAIDTTTDRLTGDALDYARSTCADAQVSIDVSAVRAVLTTRYLRSTLLLTDGSRATLDTALTWVAQDGRELHLANHVILETKSALLPSALDHALWRMGIRPARISKFATGMAALHPELPSNKWHRVLQRYFEPANTSASLASHLEYSAA